jgi:transcriptional regulator with GAF, ATPase, and Fis domain
VITLILEIRGRRESYPFHADSVVIGRADDADLRVDSRYVTARHCRIEKLPDGGFRIADLDSQNGTFVNGAEVQQTRLNVGDEIRVGPVRCWFQQAPRDITQPIGAPTEVTDGAEDEAVTVSTRGRTPDSSAAESALRDVMKDLRTAHGDVRGLAELERLVLAVSGRIFPKTAFQSSLDAARVSALARSIATSDDFERTLQLIMDAATELTASERGFLVLRDSRGEWRVRCARNFDHEAVKSPELKISRSLAEQVARTGKPVISVNAQDDDRLTAWNSIANLKLRSVICLPLLFRERVIGTLYLDNRFREGNYGERELRLLETFADQASVALENARLLKENTEQEQSLAERKRELEELAEVLEARAQATRAENAPPARSDLAHEYPAIIGESPALLNALRLLDRVVAGDLPVLISGESGTGKELVAAAIHEYSSRKNRKYVKENCAAIPESLLESELFGHKRGAFTGAIADRRGLFEEAHGGTIFLDEIGEMSLEMQAKLLRVLENGEIRPVGSHEVRRVDARIVTATNRDLAQLVREGRFRSDLFFRLNVVNISLPPLRERMTDLPVLVQHFLTLAAERMRIPAKAIDPLALRQLRGWHWPGNVRELQNELQRAMALSGSVITLDDLSANVREARPAPASSAAGQLKDLARVAASQKEMELIRRSLEETGFLKSETARRLGISRPTLDQKIKQFDLDAFVAEGRKRSGRKPNN